MTKVNEKELKEQIALLSKKVAEQGRALAHNAPPPSDDAKYLAALVVIKSQAYELMGVEVDLRELEADEVCIDRINSVINTLMDLVGTEGENDEQA